MPLATLLRISRLPANYKTCFIRLPCCHSKLLVFLNKTEKNFPTFLYARNKKKYCRESGQAVKSVVFTTTSGGFRGGDEPNDFGRKICLNLTISAEKSVSISVKTFFFVLFWRPPDFGRKKRLNFRFRSKNQSQFR